MLTGAKRKNGGDWGIKKKSYQTWLHGSGSFPGSKMAPIRKSFASEQSRRAPEFALGTFVLENFYEPFKKKKKKESREKMRQITPW